MLTSVHIGNTAIQSNHQYMLQDVEHELLEDMQDLRIHIDPKLKFHAHTDIVTNKANCTLGLMHQCKDSNVILKLCTSLVRPLLEYNNVIWGPHYVIDKQKVEAIQR